MNEKILRLALFAAVAGIHIILILFFAVNVAIKTQQATEKARVMKVTDLDMTIPVEEERPIIAPPVQEVIHDSNVVEAIAENMIETDYEPDQIVVAAGTLITPSTANVVIPAAPTWDDYLPIHRVSDPPKFDEREIAADLVYPPIALRSAIEGRVILELFVDRNGTVQRITILQENPKDRGFGDAAIKAFTGKKGAPAMANGEPVSARYRYPVSFKIK